MYVLTSIKKYRALPNGIKASGWNIISTTIQKGINFITIPIFIRLMSAKEFGEFSLFISWYTFFSILGSLNLFHSTTYNGLTKNPDDKDGVITSFQSLTLLTSILLLGVVLVFRSSWTELTGLPISYVYYMCASIAFFSAYNLWVTKERYDYKYRGVTISSLALSLAIPLVAIFAMEHSADKANARVVSYSLIQIVFGICFYIYNAIKGRKLINFRYWGYALYLNIPLLPHYLASVVLSESDRIMIGNICNKESVAYYSLSYNVGMIMIIVITAINNTFTPYIYKCLKNNEGSKVEKTSSALGAILMSMCVLIMTAGPEIISLLGTEQYLDAKWVIPPIACSVYFCFLYPFFSSIELFHEKTILVSISSVISAALNVILNYIFIPKYGYYAAAYTTLICYMAYSSMHFIFSRMILFKMNIKEKYYNEFYLFGIGTLGIVMMFINIILYNHLAFRLLLLFIELAGVVMLGIKIQPVIGDIVKKHEKKD